MYLLSLNQPFYSNNNELFVYNNLNNKLLKKNENLIVYIKSNNMYYSNVFIYKTIEHLVNDIYNDIKIFNNDIDVLEIN
jgi:hypothetical protein